MVRVILGVFFVALLIGMIVLWFQEWMRERREIYDMSDPEWKEPP